MRTVIVQDRAEVEPSPANDLQVGKVGLPQLIDSGGVVFELTGSLHHYERRTGNSSVSLNARVSILRRISSGIRFQTWAALRA